MAFLGAVLSYSLGLTLDATRIASIKAGGYVCDLAMGDKEEKSLPTGIELATGRAVVNGVVLRMVQEQELKTLELKEVPFESLQCDLSPENDQEESVPLLQNETQERTEPPKSVLKLGVPLPCIKELESTVHNAPMESPQTQLSSSI